MSSPVTHDRLDERQFLLAVRRLADSLAGGADASPYLGSGVDYAQTRPYAAGDATRAIDWRVTARTGKTFVKEYEAHKRMTVHVAVDASASMRLGSGSRTKFEWAVMLAGALALAGQSRQNPVGLYATTLDARATHVRPTLARDEVHQWLVAMYGPENTARPGEAVAAMLRRVDNDAAERGVLVVVSDLHEPDAVGALKHLANRHDVLVLRLSDAAERRPIRAGFFRAAEAETGRRFLGLGDTSVVFPDARGALAAARIDCIELCVNDAFLPRLQLFLSERKRAGRR